MCRTSGAHTTLVENLCAPEEATKTTEDRYPKRDLPICMPMLCGLQGRDPFHRLGSASAQQE